MAPRRPYSWNWVAGVRNRTKPCEAMSAKGHIINRLHQNRGRRSHGGYSSWNQLFTAVSGAFFAKLIPKNTRLYCRFSGRAPFRSIAHFNPDADRVGKGPSRDLIIFQQDNFSALHPIAELARGDTAGCREGSFSLAQGSDGEISSFEFRVSSFNPQGDSCCLKAR
jgi:hypothetical protein